MPEPSNSSRGGRSDPPKPQSIFALSDLTPEDIPDEVYIPPPPPPRAFVHTAVAGVSAETDTIEFPWYWTRLDHPGLNGNPNAIISVTPRGKLEFNQEESTANLRQNPHAVGVVYREGQQRWYIYNLNLAAMSAASFNVVIEERYR